MPFKRPDIPELNPRYQASPSNINITRSFPTGELDFLRMKLNEKQTLKVNAPELAGAKVWLKGNFPGDTQEMKETQPGEFTCDFSSSKPGKFFFHCEFTLKGQKNLERDKAPRTRVLVDPAQLDNIRLYSFLPNVSGNITQWMEELDRIKELGFNMIHLLPITVMDTSESPYSAKDLFDVDPYYRDPDQPGTALDQFEKFVQKAKKLGLGLCFDLVLNHIGINSYMAQKCPDWLIRDEKSADGFKRAGCQLGDNWHIWTDLALINYEHADRQIRERIWDYMEKYIEFWGAYAQETKGMIRLDNLHSSNLNFISKALRNLKEKAPDLIILAELFCEGKEIKQYIFDFHLHLLMATPWETPFVPQLRDMVSFNHNAYPAIQFIFPISSHDSGTPSQEFHDVKATVPRYALASLFSTGATGMCQGVEYGWPEKIDFIKKQDKLSLECHQQFHQEISEMNGLMEKYKAFKTGGNIRLIDRHHEAVLAALRKSGTDKDPDV
ncbi:MAG: hypothetical protein HQL32_08160, partial [Planctomycetes bacterium]|nr:hypothetical protein [Planctomycetota bacterium]